MKNIFLIVFLVLICALPAFTKPLVLKNKAHEIQIKDLDLDSVITEEELCDINDPSDCDKNPDSRFKKIEFKDLDKGQKKLLDAAEKVTVNSHSPYSHFRVGAALLSTDGEIITGTNFENAAYGSTICAERAAILRANAMGKKKFTKIAIYGKGKDFDSLDPVSPCGACRQVILEISQLSKENIEVIMSNSKKDQIIIARIEDLLPLGFGPKNLGIEI